MTDTTCDKCGYEWDYGGQSDHYCTCPSCKGSVKVGNDFTPEEKEKEEKEREGDSPNIPPDQVPEPEVLLENGDLQREVPVTDAVKEVHESVNSIGAATEVQRQQVDEVADDVARLREEVREVARYFQGVVEELGGEVEYETVDLGEDSSSQVSKAVRDVNPDEGPYDPTEEFDG